MKEGRYYYTILPNGDVLVSLSREVEDEGEQVAAEAILKVMRRPGVYSTVVLRAYNSLNGYQRNADVRSEHGIFRRIYLYYSGRVSYLHPDTEALHEIEFNRGFTHIKAGSTREEIIDILSSKGPRPDEVDIDIVVLNMNGGAI